MAIDQGELAQHVDCHACSSHPGEDHLQSTLFNPHSGRLQLEVLPAQGSGCPDERKSAGTADPDLTNIHKADRGVGSRFLAVLSSICMREFTSSSDALSDGDMN